MAAKPNPPGYRRRVLDIEVPVAVVVARKTMPLDQVLQLVPGAMIQFTQPCDEPLTLEVVGRQVGSGVAVKIGDKFGLKLSDMATPKRP